MNSGDGDESLAVAADQHRELIGSVLDERYCISELLGAGGMSVVYEATDLVLGRVVAVKLLKVSRLTDPASCKRFAQEGQVLSALEHTNIARVYAMSVLPSGQPYIVMEKLAGRTLADVLAATTGGLDTHRAAVIMQQVCQGLAYAHSRGVIHRDLKPSNIMLVSEPHTGGAGAVKIFDFGIAKRFDESGQSVQALTQAGDVLGSPPYMSPEQCIGAPTDQRSDIYALGCIYYQMVVGKPPFVGKTAVETLSMHLSESPPLVSRGSVKLQKLIARCLSKRPEDRFASISELLNELAAGGTTSRWYRILLPFQAGLKLAPAVLVVIVAICALVALLACSYPDQLTSQLVQSLPLNLGQLEFCYDRLVGQPGLAHPLTQEAILRRLMKDQSKDAMAAADALGRLAHLHKQLGHEGESAEEYNRAIRIYVDHFLDKDRHNQKADRKFLQICQDHPRQNMPTLETLDRLTVVCQALLNENDPVCCELVTRGFLALFVNIPPRQFGEPSSGLSPSVPIVILLQLYSKEKRSLADTERLQELQLDLKKREHAPGPIMAMFYQSLAETRIEEKRWTSAREVVQIGLHELSRSDDPLIHAMLLDQLARICLNEHKYAEAQKVYADELAILRAATDMSASRRLQLANTMSAFCLAYRWDKLPLTGQSVRFAYKLACQQLPDKKSTSDAFDALLNMDRYLTAISEPRQAYEVVTRALALRYDQTDVCAARLYSAAGNHLLALKSYAKALQCLRQTERILSMHTKEMEGSGTDAVELVHLQVSTWHSQSECYRWLRDYQSAVRLTYTSLPFCQRLPVDHPDRQTYETAIIIQRCLCLCMMGKYQQAYDDIIPLYGAVRRSPDASDWRYVRTADLYLDICHKLHRYDELRTTLSEARAAARKNGKDEVIATIEAIAGKFTDSVLK